MAIFLVIPRTYHDLHSVSRARFRDGRTVSRSPHGAGRLADAHHSLADVVAREEADERLGCVRETRHDVFANLELARSDPRFQLGERSFIQVAKVAVDE